MKKKKAQRRIVIGDVHGCAEELLDLLDRCKYDSSKDRLILAGDLVDKGPESKRVVQNAIMLDAECVLGNHDEKHLRWNRWLRKKKENPEVNIPMKDNGFFWEMTDKEFHYFESMPLYILDGDWCIVHAGLECDGRWPHQMDPKVMVRIRDVHWKTGLYHQPPQAGERATGAVRWAERWQGPVNVIYGHAPGYDVKIDRQGLLGKVCLGIDTGAVHGGYLTALIYDDRVWNICQVRGRQKYAEPFVVAGEEPEDYVQFGRAFEASHP